MSLISLPVYNTEENKRIDLVGRCLFSLAKTVDWNRHRLFIIDDASTCPRTKRFYESFEDWLPFTLIENERNIGTARSVNRGWQQKRDDEYCVKMDSDIIISDNGWADKLEDAMSRDPNLGICCLKRRDLAENPHWPDGHCYKSELISLPHEPGQMWHVVEKVGHCIGSVQMYSPALLSNIGYMAQFGKYGLDDSLAAVRCAVAGFYSAFYCGIDIEHPDPGDTPYQAWKQDYAGERMDKFSRMCLRYTTGGIPVWHGPDEDLDNLEIE